MSEDAIVALMKAERRRFWVHLAVVLVLGLALGAASVVNRRDIDWLMDVSGVPR